MLYATQISFARVNKHSASGNKSTEPPSTHFVQKGVTLT